MYQVIRTEGEYEPWWFFEDWKEFIVYMEEFSRFEEARARFEAEYKSLAENYPQTRTKNQYLSAFWDEAECRFCESCDDDVQVYHGVMILRDYIRLEE